MMETAADGGMLLEIPVKDPCFDLTKAVCSHGFFMMAPNQWDPSSCTFQRPIRLSSGSVRVQISQPQSSCTVVVSVARSVSLSSEDERALIDQVCRMLRISDDNDRIIQEFHRVHPASQEKRAGRIFRSPTLFEDMVKCILLCNCQWPRTLSMARALCGLQLQTKPCSNSEAFHPKTPQQREQKGNALKKKKKTNIKLETKFADESSQGYDSSESSDSFREAIGDFPTPEEMASLDASYLADRCKLGYRAQRIVSLAQSIVNGDLQLRKLEEMCEGHSLSSYDALDRQLSALIGFGPFTRANVLMCMGFYHRVPADTETVRHIRQFHGRNCHIESVQKDIEAIYGKYAPFQFLAYWTELWGYYEERFGTCSKMPASHYPMATASNMKEKSSKGSKVKKIEPEEQ